MTQRPTSAPRATSDPIAVSPQDAADFGARVVAWQRAHGRHDLPWQHTRNPYAIWISEIMLQQTQVATVIPFYERFMRRFPDVGSLASAPADDVMQMWAGLGYYSRARNLHKAAQAIMGEHAGCFPSTPELLAALPGIGRSTSAAIAAFAYGARCAILDGNVKRVLCRCFAVGGDPAASAVERSLWTLAESLAPAEGIEAYTQGVMDIGATVCTRSRPNCAACPLSSRCRAFADGRTEELPQVRKRKPVPERSVAMLVLRHGAQVLLEKRPSTGIWGGLWSLPEAEVGADLKSLCLQRFGAREIVLQRLDELVHGFTHFRLRIEPWRVEVGAVDSKLAEPGLVWLPVDDAAGAAVPVPVRKILEMQ